MKHKRPPIISDAQVAERYGISRAAVWRLCKKGLLPLPAHWYGGVAEWSPDVLDAFDRARPSKPFAVDRQALAGHQYQQHGVAG